MPLSTLDQRIEGRSQTRILREFATNSALYPVFDAIRMITTEGVIAYLQEIPHYLIFLSALLQAYYLGRRTDYTWWQRAAGNLIGFGLYSLFDILIEGPSEFFDQPYHWVFFGFTVGMALLAAFEELFKESRMVIIILANLWRVLLFPTLYVLSELSGELSGTLNWHNFMVYWNSSSGHAFILLAALLFGLMLGLRDAQLDRYTVVLQELSRRLKKYSEWLLDPALIEKSLDDDTALGQRRVERIILFMDIRGFTAWSENRPPEIVVGMLNRFYDIAEKIIVEGEGQKPHYIGDEVMTWFTSPLAAVETTHRLQQELSRLLHQYELGADTLYFRTSPSSP